MTARNCCAPKAHNNLLSLPDFPSPNGNGPASPRAAQLWDMEYKASGNFRRAIECESSCHAAVQPEYALRSVWRKHDDTNFLFLVSQSTSD